MRRDYSFPVELQDDPDGGVMAIFPDVPEAIAHGSRSNGGLQPGQTGARSCPVWLSEGGSTPCLGQREAASGSRPQTTDILKIAVVEGWLDLGLSKAEFARLLGVDEKEARRILDPDAATKADRLEEALAVLGRKLHIAVEAA